MRRPITNASALRFWGAKPARIRPAGVPDLAERRLVRAKECNQKRYTCDAERYDGAAGARGGNGSTGLLYWLMRPSGGFAAFCHLPHSLLSGPAMSVTDPDRIHELLERHILTRVETPGQYVGGERNAVRKDPDRVDVSFALLFPDLYTVGTSHLGYQILHTILNDLPWAAAERAYAPWPDMQEQMRTREIPLYALESFRPVAEFDVVGFTLQYELLYTNVLAMLELAGIPLEREQRNEEHPLVIAGGPGAAAPEPMTDFVDLFFVGDGESSVVRFAQLLRRLKSEGVSRDEMILEAARELPCVYAPLFYRPSYRHDGTLAGLEPTRPDVPTTVRAAKLEELDGATFPRRPIVPLVETVHERVSVEIMRGCTRGCRFCQAGLLNRPARCRSGQDVLSLAEEAWLNTGYDRVSLASLSSSDYPEIGSLVQQCASAFEPRHVDISLPSLRVSDQIGPLSRNLKAVRKSGLTIAPEAATERLRRVINKDISEEVLYQGVRAAFARGWRHMKLYFMIGLPTETDQDVAGIVDMCERVSAVRKEVANSPGRVNVSIAPFVPKAHTPFQWEPMAPLQTMRDRQALLKDRVSNKRVRFKFHTPERSYLEALLARGDRRLGRAIRRAHELGEQFDAWDEYFSFSTWMQALEDAGLDAGFYVCRERSEDELLPWDHIDAGVTKKFLLAERHRAFEGRMTPDCRRDKCHGCGACGQVGR